MSAIVKILDKRQAKRWADADKTVTVNVQGSIEHSAAPELMAHQQKVFELQARAQARIALKGPAELPTIDAEIIDE
jgi:hypothetical protein